MNVSEQTFAFACEGAELVGITHLPETPERVGVLIVVGGPQYRVGSHRQFVLLARALATAGFAAFRFDYRGMGDSSGELKGFQFIDADIRAAIDEFKRRVPSLQKIVLWGLCDGATASSVYAASDERVAGLVLLNPWVRSSQTLAKSLLTGYYARRLLDVAAWRKVLSQPRALAKSVASVFSLARATVDKSADATKQLTSSATSAPATRKDEPTLVDQMDEGLHRFKGNVLLILSGADITANEFLAGVKSCARLEKRLQQAGATTREISTADHTFSRAQWRDQVAEWTREWLASTMR
jgi:uncharacterized protein